MHSQRLWLVKTVARVALGVVWLYLGLVSKLLFLVPFELEIVERSGLHLASARTTLQALGVVEVLLGLWLISGYRERLACAVTTLSMVVLVILVAIEEPAVLLGPFGGLIKNVCLVACAWIVWHLSPATER